MARIALIEPDQAPPEVKEIYHQKFKGKPGNAQKAIAQRPDMLKNCLGFYASAGRSLDRKLYELIYIRVSMINQCHYCLQHHLASSKRTGVTPEDWKALQEAKALNHRDTEEHRGLSTTPAKYCQACGRFSCWAALLFARRESRL